MNFNKMLKFDLQNCISSKDISRLKMLKYNLHIIKQRFIIGL